MMKPFLLAMLALFLSGLSLAQAQQPAPNAVRSPAFAPSHVEAAREVIALSGMTRSFDAILPQFSEQIRQRAVTRPELTKDLNEVLEALKPELELQKKEMITLAAQVFSGKLTEAELKDIATFFKSSAGEKYVETQPQVLDAMFIEMQGWTQRVAEYVMVRVRAEMGKRGHQM
jgi:uncharacterized protein